jgi:hypothetical protein
MIGRVLGCVILFAVLLGGCKKSPGVPTKEAAQQMLRDVLAALEKQDLDTAVGYFFIPQSLGPDEARQAIGSFLERREISKEGLDVLFAQGKWGPLADVVGREKAERFAKRLETPVGELWGYFGPEENGEAIFRWDGSLKLIRLDDVGKLGAPAASEPGAPPAP